MTIQELADRAEVTTRTIRYYVEQGVLPPPGYGRPAEYTEEHVKRLALIKRLKEQYLPLEEIRDTLQHLSLSEVEQLVEQYSPPAQETIQQQKLESASDYLNNVLGRGMAREQMKKRMPDPADDRRRTIDDEMATDALAEVADFDFAHSPVAPPIQMPPAAMAPPLLAPAAPGAAPSVESAPSSVVRRRSSEEEGATAGKPDTYMKSPAPVEEEEQSGVAGRPSTWERVSLGDGVELHYPTGANADTRGKVARLIEAARRILGMDPGNGEQGK